MGRWGLLHVFIHIELVVHLLAHRRNLDEDFEHNITAGHCDIGVYKVYVISDKPNLENHESLSMSRASHTVDVDPNPNPPMTCYRSLITSPSRVG